MKKILFIFLAFLPLISNAQAEAASSFSGLIGGLMVIGVAILIFLVFRQIVLWYWKVDLIIKNQEIQIRSQQETNNLLSEQISILKGYYKQD